MLALPLKDTPLMSRAVASTVALATLSVMNANCRRPGPVVMVP
jgi:hypothetical protein